MRLIYDTLTGRTILILIFGALLIELDIILVTSLLDDQEQGFLSWFSVSSVVFLGLIFIGYIISRQLVKPLKQLSETAQRFSTDMQCSPLPLKGPKEVREAAQSFNLMQQRIQRFVEERMQLVAAISHDLRTPLTRLRLRVDGLPDSEQQKAIRDIEEMRSMIQSTLAFIRDDAAKEQSTKIDLASLLSSICDETSDAFGPAEFQGPDKCIRDCKPMALKRALTNLIENAVKYGKQANVILSCTNDIAQIIISDQGNGIPETEFENVFLPFYRIEKSRNRKTGGVGLGMSVARTIIQGHGGKISLCNQTPQQGLCITIELPGLENLIG